LVLYDHGTVFLFIMLFWIPGRGEGGKDGSKKEKGIEIIVEAVNVQATSVYICEEVEGEEPEGRRHIRTTNKAELEDKTAHKSKLDIKDYVKAPEGCSAGLRNSKRERERKNTK